MEKDCKHVLDELKILLDARKYYEVCEYLDNLKSDDSTINEIKLGLVITKAFKQHDIIKDSRASLLEYLENRTGRKEI